MTHIKHFKFYLTMVHFVSNSVIYNIDRNSYTPTNIQFLNSLFHAVAGPPGTVVISAIPDFFQILLTWEPPEGPPNTITVYEVSHRLVVQPENVTRENTTDLTRRLTVSGLEPGTEVTFTVRAYSQGGAGEEVTVTVSTLTRPRE